MAPSNRLRDPIVLVHGLCGFDRIVAFQRPFAEYFPGIRSFLESEGNRVLTPRMSPTASIARRAWELRQFIRKEVGNTPVHIFGHSLGGLDSRYMISRLGMEEQVLSLTSIGTPHRGTAFADWGITHFAAVLQPCFQAIGLPDQAFFDLTTRRCREFNQETPDVPSVRYFSVAGDCRPPLLGLEWVLPYRIVGQIEGPNDGVVSVASAIWGEATETWHGDHLNLVNWPNRQARKLGLEQDRVSDYGRLVERLVKLGF